MSESYCVGKEACPKCGSRDNLARYSDGHAHCFTPGCDYRERASGEAPTQQTRKTSVSDLIHGGEVSALPKRGLSEETCAKFGYRVATVGGTAYQIAPYYRDGQVVAQHLRTAGKTFAWRGDSKDVELFGQHLWREAGKMVVVTEGEIDCMTVSQLQGNKWPVVSLPNGAASARKSIAANIEWFEKFDHVILMFDMDEPGREAVAQCAPLFRPGKCKVATLPLKDANEMLQAGRGAEVISAIWDAKEYRPDGLVTLADLKDAMMQEAVLGLPWAWEELTALTHGRHWGNVITLGAGTGVGKTDFLTQQVAHDLTVLRLSVGCFFLEQTPSETGKRIAGKLAGKRFHIPGAGWTTEELAGAVNTLLDPKGPQCYLYDSWGATEWDQIKSRMRFLRHSCDVRLFYLDHLTALAAAADDERKELEAIMAELAALAKELQVVVTVVSHLSTPEGKPHEEGGRVMIRHFKGSRSIGYWSHFMLGLERDQQAESEEERKRTAVRILKARFDGSKTGSVFYLGYNEDTGVLNVVPAESSGFKDETRNQSTVTEF